MEFSPERAAQLERYLATVARAKSKWYQKNKPHVRSYDKLRYQQNPKLKEDARAYRQEMHLRALVALSGDPPRCKCGFSDIRALQIDHISGGGHAEWQGYTRIRLYRDIARCPDKTKYQVLCANCNWIKRHTEEEYGGPVVLTKRGGISNA